MNKLRSFLQTWRYATVVLGFLAVLAPSSSAQRRPNIKIVPVEPVKNEAPQSARPSAKLTAAQKQQMFRGVLESLSQESAQHPELKLAQVFPLAKTNYDYNFTVLPTTLTPAAPWSTTGHLTFFGGGRIGPSNDAGLYSAEFHGSSDSRLLVWMNLSPGIYLVDFTVSAFSTSDPMKVSIDPFQSTALTMQTEITQGHLLVPLLISKAGFHSIFVSRPSTWLFYSVEINKT